MTIVQTIEIPADHRLVFDVPQEVPEGKAKVKLSIKPFKLFAKRPKKDCNGRTDGIPLGNGRIYYPAPPGYIPGPPDPELAPYIKEAEERAARERATGKSTWGSMMGCWKDSPRFAGKDGVELQREMRDD
ncbi:hypothetical protein AGMMS49944_27570 [Spirochaetia bacterium]|nr:hypothetical protein AGMMS49944_27570 [Spirochaetia bacterium]